MLVYICVKFHENILNGIRVMEVTRKLTDGQTVRLESKKGHNTVNFREHDQNVNQVI